MSAQRDPSRLLEPDSTAPAGLRSALGAARDVTPSPADVAALAARLPLPPGPTSGPDAAGGTRENTVSGQSAAGPLAKGAELAAPSAIPGAIVGAVLGLVTGVGWLATTGGAPPAAVVSLPASIAATAPGPTAAAPPASTTGTPPAASSTSVGARVGAGGGPPAGSQESESELLQLARAEARSHPSAALARVAEHASRFPRSSLSQEREVIAITALVTAGRAAEAHARAERFFAAHPGSAHLARIDALFAGSKTGEADKNSPAPPPPTP